MASQSVTSFAAALKTLYPNRAIADLVYPVNTLFGMIKKREDFYGENMVVPVSISDISGLNQSFSAAQGNKNGTTKKKFTVTRVKEYGICSVDNELIEASASNKGAFVSALKTEMDAAFRGVARRIGSALYRDASGQLGTISTGTTLASTTLELTNKDDVVNFYLNQQIVFAANNTSALRSATARTIQGIDEDAGTLTLDANVNAAATAIAQGDAIFTSGDYASASDRNRISGLGAWCPSSAPGTADSFFGLNRSTHATRLAGHRITGTSLQIDEAIYKAAVRIARSGGKPSHVFVNHVQYEVLQNVLGSKVVYDKAKSNDADIYFEGVKFMGPAGPLMVLPDYNCQPDVAWVLDMDAVELCSLNKAPHILGLDGDGLRLLRDSSTDSYEIRTGFYGNLCVWAPYHVARVSLTVPS